MKKYKNYIDYLIKSIFAGIMIGIAGTVYLRVDNNLFGAFLFSIGLLVICMYGMNLFTGKVGYVLINKFNYIYELLITIVGNFIGTFLIARLVLLTRFKSISDKAVNLVNLKLNDNLLSIFILSMLCGILMYIAVNNYKKINNEIGKYSCIFMCVMVFILSGFEHSIANMYYISVANMINLKSLLYILIMLLGNSVGSILIALYYNRFYKN